MKQEAENKKKNDKKKKEETDLKKKNAEDKGDLKSGTKKSKKINLYKIKFESIK